MKNWMLRWLVSISLILTGLSSKLNGFETRLVVMKIILLKFFKIGLTIVMRANQRKFIFKP
jgi:hypothetical protein